MGKTKYIPFDRILTPGQVARITEDSPYLAGIIKSVQIAWPNGCNGLVDVAAWYGNQDKLVPQQTTTVDFLALNDITPTYDGINIEKNDGTPVWVEMRNRDAINPHHIVVVIAIEVN